MSNVPEFDLINLSLRAQEGPHVRRKSQGGTGGWGIPHCDPLVLHGPGECQYCDLYPEAQYLRELWGVNFTKHRWPGKLVCPAERDRPLGTIQRWVGNTPEEYDELDHFPTEDEVQTAVSVLRRVDAAINKLRNQ